MSTISKLIDEHHKLLQITCHIKNHLQENILEESFQYVHSCLYVFAEALRPHLIYENETLFPDMISNDDEASKVINEITEKTGDLVEKLDEFMLKWSHPSTILESPTEFINETRQFLLELNVRIALEEIFLFPLINKENANSPQYDFEEMIV